MRPPKRRSPADRKAREASKVVPVGAGYGGNNTTDSAEIKALETRLNAEAERFKAWKRRTPSRRGRRC